MRGANNSSLFRLNWSAPMVTTVLCLLLLASPSVLAEDHDEPDNSFTVLLSQDNFFGFYPSFNGLLGISDNLDFSFYGIFWTKPAFGLGSVNEGDDLWTEFGAGVNLHFLDDTLTVKPQLGITNGALLSGGALDSEGNVTGANFADGVVPSLTVNYSSDRFEAEFYGGYYLALKDRSDNAALDFLHTWINAGYKFNDNFSLGAHWEWLDNTRNTYPGGSTSDVYKWLGAYAQFSLPVGAFARFTAGADTTSGGSGDFYKMTIGYTF